MIENFDQFSKIAKETFGDKVMVAGINSTQENLDEINKIFKLNITKEDLENYGSHVWLVENKCPQCGADLLGLFGSFSWGIVHGEGSCSECDQVLFRYYHYIGENRTPITAFSVIGF